MPISNTKLFSLETPAHVLSGYCERWDFILCFDIPNLQRGMKSLPSDERSESITNPRDEGAKCVAPRIYPEDSPPGECDG